MCRPFPTPSRRLVLAALGALAIVGPRNRAVAQTAGTGATATETPAGPTADADYTRWVAAMAVSSDSRLLAAGTSGGVIALFDLATQKLVRTMAYPDTQNTLGALHFADENRMLIAGNGPRRRRSKGVALIAYDVADGSRLSQGSASPDWAAAIVGAPKSELIGTIGHGYDRSIRLWYANGFQLQRLWPAHESTVMALAMSRDGRLLASGGGDSRRLGRDPTVRIWAVASGRELHRLSSHKNGIESVAFTPDGRHVASLSAEALKLWDTRSGQVLKSLAISTRPLETTLLVSPAADWFATATRQADNDALRTVTVRSIASAKTIGTWTGDASGVPSLAASPDGRLLLIGRDDGRIVIREVATGKQIAILEVPASTATP